MVQAKFMLGHSRGCTIRLAHATDHVGLSEGIEDALSVMQLYGLACWATGSTSGLINVQLPPEIGRVTICADNDVAGISSARKAAKRLMVEGRQVDIIAPPYGHKDFNDLINIKKEKAAPEGTAEGNYHDCI